MNANWSSLQAPNTNIDAAVFGTVITAPRTVVVDSAVTVKSVAFDNSNKYAIARTGSVNLEAATGNAELTVVQGSHEFQARVNLASEVNASIAAGATLEIDNRLSLNGHTLTKTGAGAMLVNYDLHAGGGAIEVLAGVLSGGGTVDGNLINSSGVVAAGQSAGMLTIADNFTRSGGGALDIELGGSEPGIEHDQLKVNGQAARQDAEGRVNWWLYTERRSVV